MEQLACVMEVFGTPPQSLVDLSNRKNMFFDSNNEPRIVANSRGKKRRPDSRELAAALNCSDAGFNSFLAGTLAWDPRERFTPETAIQHEWILEGLQGHHPPRSSRVEKAAKEAGRALPSISKPKAASGSSTAR